MLEEKVDKLLAVVERLEAEVLQLSRKQATQEWYTTEEFARLIGRSEYTVREWVRLSRVRAEKRRSGRGRYFAWVISHAELLRFQREGLIPYPTAGS